MPQRDWRTFWGRIKRALSGAALWALAGMFPDETGKLKTDF
jgi:hypothetical protein